MVTLIATLSVSAQTGGDYSIEKSVIASGGGTSQGSTITVSGTVGQVTASQQITGASYSLTGGFWHANNTNDIIFKNGFE